MRKPPAPGPGDCCGSGCSMCVNDVYAAALAAYEARAALYRERGIDPDTVDDDDQVEDQPPLLSSLAFHPVATVTHVTRHDSYAFIESAVDGGRPLGHALGQHVWLRSERDGVLCSRPYTPLDSVAAHGVATFFIQVRPDILEECH